MQNCIDAACDMACSNAGYITLRTPSLKWRPYPHAMACGRIADVTNHHPRDGEHKTLMGYDGVTDAHDHAAPGVWAPWKLVLAAWMFALGVTLWRVKRLFAAGGMSKQMMRRG